MSSKSVSAVQRLTQSMRAYQRHYSGRTLLEKSYDALGLIMNDRRSWPIREESYAAIQVRRQDRDWSTYRKFGSHTHGHEYYRRAPVSRTKKIPAAKNASSRHHNIRKQRNNEVEPVATAKEESDREPQDADQKVCSVRQYIYGDVDNEDDTEIQREFNNDLLRRVSKRRRVSRDTPLSKKVIAPYANYSNHRNRWAEFRHRMVYGSISY